MDENSAQTVTLAMARKLTAEVRVKINGKTRKLTDHEASSLAKEARYLAQSAFKAEKQSTVRQTRKALETAHKKLRDAGDTLNSLNESSRLFIVGEDEEQFVRLLAPVRELEQRLEDAIKDAQQYAEDSGRAWGGQPREESIYQFVGLLIMRYERITNRRPGKTTDPTTGRPGGPFGRYLCRSLESFWPSKAIPWGSVRKALEYYHSLKTEFDTELGEEALPDLLKKHINPT